LQEHTNSARKKVGEKIDGKSAKNFFLYSHDYRAEKRGEKGGKLSRSIRIMRAKNVGKKIVGKKFEKRFIIFTQIS